MQMLYDLSKSYELESHGLYIIDFYLDNKILKVNAVNQNDMDIVITFSNVIDCNIVEEIWIDEVEYIQKFGTYFRDSIYQVKQYPSSEYELEEIIEYRYFISSENFYIECSCLNPIEINII